MIKIKIYKETGAEPVECEVKAGTSIEELLGEYRSHLPWRVIMARVGGEDTALSYKLRRGCDLTFCDIRDDAANRAFQRGLLLLFLKAVHDIQGDGANVEICNSVNRGIFTTIGFGDCAGGGSKIDEDALRQIEKRMWELVDRNIPINVDLKTNDCELDGYTNNFYGIMPVSTGYIYSFALEQTRGGVLVRFPHSSDPGKLSIYRRDAKIFEAYEEEQALLDSLDMRYISDLNRQIKAGGATDIIRMAEERQSANIDKLAETIKGAGKRVVLIAGPSSSGKTTFSKRLIESLKAHGGPEPLYLGTDDYFIDREFAPRDKKGEFNFEGLDAVDVALFVRNIEELLAGKTANIPTYDFIAGKKIFGPRKCRLKKDQVVVVEGIHALNKKMSVGIEENVKFKVYISPLTQLNIDNHNRVPSTDVRVLRRMIRDNRTRGYSAIDTLRQWPKVRAGESVNIFPYNNEADEVFNTTLVYELPILKKYAEPLLKEIKPGEAAHGHAKWLLYFLSFFTGIEDESAIPPYSILREFIGGSCY